MIARKAIYWIGTVVGLLAVLTVGSFVAAPSLLAQTSIDFDGPDEVEPYGGQEVEYHGVIQSFTDSELVLENGTTFVIDSRTDIETLLEIGKDLEVEAINKDGGLLAVDVEANDYN